jgi:hypothetical protein
MIFTKDNPIGIDAPIKRLQLKLNGLWDADVYGRVYLNSKEGVIAEAYISNNSYKDIFVEKGKNVIGFVDLGIIDFDKTGKVQTASIDVVFTLDLSTIVPLYSTLVRNDEEALQSALNVIQKTSGWAINSVRKGNIKTVFNFMDTSKITYRDMQPYFNFAVNCKVNFLNNLNSCNL